MKIYEKDEKEQRALLGYADKQVSSPGKKESVTLGLTYKWG